MCFCCCECMTDLCLIVLSVLFPPLPVWIRRGFCSQDSLINILLFILGYFPGLIHSWYIIAKYPPYTITQESKVYYIYRGNPDLENQLPPQNNCHHHHHHHNGPVVATEPTPSSQEIQTVRVRGVLGTLRHTFWGKVRFLRFKNNLRNTVRPNRDRIRRADPRLKNQENELQSPFETPISTGTVSESESAMSLQRYDTAPSNFAAQIYNDPARNNGTENLVRINGQPN